METSYQTPKKSFLVENRWALFAIVLGVILGFGSALICIAWNLVIFGFNIMYIVSPLLAGFVETIIAIKKYGQSTGAISALLTFFLINGYGWFGPGWIFPKEPVTLSIITLIAIVLTIQAAFPIFVNHILFVVVPGIINRILGLFLRTPSNIIQLEPLEKEGNNGIKEADEIFLEELNIPLVSIPNVNKGKIEKYIGLVTGEGITEEKESEGRFSKILNIIQPTQLADLNLGEAKKEALSRMLENAESMGANAVEEVIIDFVSMGGLQGSVTIVTATGTALLVQGGSGALWKNVQKGGSAPGMSENPNSVGVKDISSDNESILRADEKIKEKDHVIATNELFNAMDLSLNESEPIISGLGLATDSDLIDLEMRFSKVSKNLEGNLEGFDNDLEKNKKYAAQKISAIDDVGMLIHKSDYKGMMNMRLKEEMIGKEVVDINAMIIGKVKDVEVNFQTKTLEAFVIGKGGILESLGSSGNDIIVPLNMVVAIGDKIIVKSETQ